MTRTTGRLTIAALVALVASCAAATPEPEAGGGSGATIELQAGYRAYTGFMPTSTRALSPREPECPLDVILAGPPDRPHAVIGLVTAERVGSAITEMAGGEERAIEWLRAVACQAGAQAMFDVRTSSDFVPYVGRSIRGRAVAAVYLDGPPPPPPGPSSPPPPPGGSWGGPPPPPEGEGAAEEPGDAPSGPQPGDPEPPPASW